MLDDPDRGYVCAIVGATGAVGAVLLSVLEERGFPVAELRPLASERSVGTTIEYAGAPVEVRKATADEFDGADLVFFAATGSLSRDLAPEAAKRGAIAIDKSSTWRMDDKVPLVVPEINADALDDHTGIVACPNCTTIPLAMALEPLRRRAGLRSVVVTTMQAVSGAGLPGIEELEGQQRAEAAGRAAPEPKAFAEPIHNNVVPLCETLREDGYSTEETKLLQETRKILRQPDLAVTMTCVRVPVPVGHSAAVLIETETPLSPEEAGQELQAFPGIEVCRGDDLPTPMRVAGRDEILVGRIRKDQSSDRLWLWQVGDNLRKGAATNAVQIAEALAERGLLRGREPANLAQSS